MSADPKPSIHDGWTPQPQVQEQPNPETVEPCDHAWEHIDESFGYEYGSIVGTQEVHSWECAKCGATTTKQPEVFP